jgi:hypothetical protein
LEYEARAQQALDAAEQAKHELADLRQQKDSNSEEVKRLQEEARKRVEEAAKYQKVARDLQIVSAQTVPRDAAEQAVDLATKRANRAESERDQYRASLDQVNEERDGLRRQLDAFRKSAVQQTSPQASRMEKVACRLDRIRVLEDGSVSETRWNFQIIIRTEGASRRVSSR